MDHMSKVKIMFGFYFSALVLIFIGAKLVSNKMPGWTGKTLKVIGYVILLPSLVFLAMCLT